MSTEPLRPAVRIDSRHITDGFESGAEELDEWIQRFALVNDRSGNANVFVVTRGDVVVGYYALATSGVSKSAVPDEIKKGGVPSTVPCLLLARLAVDRSEQNRKLGRALLVDAMRRCLRAADEVGARAFLVHARNDTAKAFYLRQANFLESPSDSLHLMILLKKMRVTLREGQAVDR